MATNESRKIETGGGTYLEGPTDTGGGDFVAGDKVIQTLQLDVQKLIEALSDVLPDDDPLPDQLLNTLKGFQFFHNRLYEWKELHNYLNDITFSLDQFLREVERLDINQAEPDPRPLARLWRPVARKTVLLLDWAATVEHIAPAPFSVSADNLSGPPWAVEMHVSMQRIDNLLEQAAVGLPEVYDASFDFHDAVERHMYLADKSLRETAGELYNLSRIVLGSMSHE